MLYKISKTVKLYIVQCTYHYTPLYKIKSSIALVPKQGQCWYIPPKCHTSVQCPLMPIPIIIKIKI